MTGLNMKAFYLMIYIHLMLLLFSCSKYTIDDGSGNGMDVHIKFQKNAVGDAFDIEYPVRVFCTDIAGASIKDVTFRQGGEITFPLAKGEYCINAFVGWDDDNYTLKDGPDGKQMVTMKNSSMAERL